MPTNKRVALGEKIALRDFFPAYVPAYHSQSWRPFLVHIMPWTDAYSTPIRALSAKRANNRIASYIDLLEIERVRTKLDAKDSASIRFGVSKDGRGYKGDRGDFCLVGGSIRGQHLNLFYRSLELIGGFGFDVVLIDHLGVLLGRQWRSVMIHAASAAIFAPACNSSQTKPNLFRALTRIFEP